MRRAVRNAQRGSDDPATTPMAPRGEGSRMATEREQKDVLAKKDNVTEGARGLQQWGDEAMPDEGARGTGAEGTAERAARIGRGQLAQKDKQE